MTIATILLNFLKITLNQKSEFLHGTRNTNNEAQAFN